MVHYPLRIAICDLAGFGPRYTYKIQRKGSSLMISKEVDVVTSYVTT